MMHLDDFQIEIRPEDLRRLPRQPEQRVDAHAEIRGEHDGNFPRRLADRSRAAQRVCPVVPMTSGLPRRTARREERTSAAALLKSMTTSPTASAAAGSSSRPKRAGDAVTLRLALGAERDGLSHPARRAAENHRQRRRTRLPRCALTP